MKITGRIVSKRYRCSHCGNESQVQTNHWGAIYSPCSECSWKRPGKATISNCMEDSPDGYGIPTPWKIVRLGDIAEITKG